MSEFQNEIPAMRKHINSIRNGQEPQQDYSQISTEMILIANEVNELIKSSGRNYFLNVADFTR